MSRRYLVIGAGGTGGCIGGFLLAAGFDVAFVARGNTLEQMHRNGLTIRSDRMGNLTLPVRVSDMEHCSEEPDVVFICVKDYSLDSVVGFLEHMAKPGTVVIPILNVYGTGEKLAARLPSLRVMGGCIYCVAFQTIPGEIAQRGAVFRMVFGALDGSRPPILDAIAQDLWESGIDVAVSQNIQRDTFKKLSTVSPMAAVGSFYHANVGAICSTPEIREDYAAAVREISSLAVAMGIPFPSDTVQENLELMESLTPESTASMQKDIARGGQSEIDGLVFEIVRLGRKYGVPTPVYDKIAERFGYKNEAVI